MQEGLAGQLERMKELAVALQDAERGKHASMSQLLQQVSERRALRPGATDNERLRLEVRAHLDLSQACCKIHY